MNYAPYLDIQFHNGYPSAEREDRKRPRIEKILQASCDPAEPLTDDTCKVIAELISLGTEKAPKDASICLKRNLTHATTYLVDIRNKSEATRLWNSSHQKKWDRNHLSKILEAFYKQKEPGKDCWRFYHHEQFDRYLAEKCAVEARGDTFNVSFKGTSLMPSRQFKSTFKTRELNMPDDANIIPVLKGIFIDAFTHSYQKQKIFDGSIAQLNQFLSDIFKKTEDDFTKTDPNEKSHLVVCFLDDSPIGFVELHYPKLPFPGAYIAQLAVHPNWKACGFGRILLEKARKCMQNETFFWGKVRKSNQRAITFYNAVVAAVPGIQFNYYDDDGNMPLAEYPAEEYGTFKCYLPKS